jgi:hypothetical protein
MAKGYIEIRKTAARGTDSVAADMMRHLHTRQHLGKAAVITDQPLAMLAAARKQWLKLSRAIQKQRAQTLNADKILKYTHTITHMQHLHFTAKGPLEAPDADVYFLEPTAASLTVMPIQCWTIYLLSEPSLPTATDMLIQLPTEALLVDYRHTLPWQAELGLQPKEALEDQVKSEWRQVQQFLATCKVDITIIENGDMRNIEAMDDALDTLLGTSRKFLQVANGFQRTLELARPIRVSKAMRVYYDTLMLLAHRVQALSPGVFTQHFLESYNEDDTFFLYDILRTMRGSSTEPLAAAYARHMAAGRANLARALLMQGSGSWPATMR